MRLVDLEFIKGYINSSELNGISQLPVVSKRLLKHLFLPSIYKEGRREREGREGGREEKELSKCIQCILKISP